MREKEERKSVKKTEPAADTFRRIVNIIFTLAGIVLLFRFVFKLLGANPENVFVENLYRITDFAVGIFDGIFAEVQWQNGVFEPATIIALVVLFVISWLIKSLFAKRTVRQEEYRATTETPKETRDEPHVQREKTVEKKRTIKREDSPAQTEETIENQRSIDREEPHTQKNERVEEQRTTDRGQNNDDQQTVENEKTRN